VEINRELAKFLHESMGLQDIEVRDFLETDRNLGTFDRIVMNSPFQNAADIAHILHAATLLNPGARLVALCANGPRQQAALIPWVDRHGGTWKELPDGSFSEAGTNVRTALLTIDID